MHEECLGTFNTGKEVQQKLRMMGFSDQLMPIPAYIKCKKCGADIVMDTFEYKCPVCGAIHVVTPCHAFDSDNIQVVEEK